MRLSVRTAGGVPAQASVPPITGLDLVGTSQSSTFTSAGGVGTRQTVWEFRLVAVQPGRAVIGPIQIRVGTGFVNAGLLSVDVTAVGGSEREDMDDRVSAILRRAPGPGGSDDVTIALVPSSDTVVLGEQLDLVVVAWFPRGIRARLRTRPTLTPPEVQGAWTYPRTSALSVVDTREVDGQLYDLYVHHQLAFPLTPGPLEVGRASVSYSLPLRTSILSREVPQEVLSEGMTIAVLPQPTEGRPRPYTGAAASGLEFAVAVDRGLFGLGQALTITATVSGRGNVALWPEPEFRWPPGVRVYPDRTDVEIVPEDGFIAGSKTFSYLVAPDSTGTFTIPGPVYSYFDLDSGRYVREQVQPIQLVARGLAGTTSSGPAPPSVMAQRDAGLLRRFSSWVGTGGGIWAVLLAFALPPLIALTMRFAPLIRWRRRPKEGAGAALGDPTLDALDREFRSKLEHLVPVTDAREGDGLPDALRAAGVEASLATHASRVRDRLRGAVYGKDGASDPTELAAEAREVLRALPGGGYQVSGSHARKARASAVALVLSLAWSQETAAQTPSAEHLFTAGAYQAAADSFRLRAAREPGEPVHWFNLGAALFGSGRETQARVAWIKAARISPRNREVKEALRSVPAVDLHARRSTWVAPTTVGESALAAAALWIAGWLALAKSRRKRFAAAVVATAVVLAGFAGYLHRHYSEPVGLVLVARAPLREAPYGAAPAPYRFAQGAAVRIEREDGAWLLVTRRDQTGWLLVDEVGRL